MITRTASSPRSVRKPTVVAAHTPNKDGAWHSLTDHLTAVAEMARLFGEPLGFGNVAYYSGLWHDGGKALPTFRKYLMACARGDPDAKRRFPDRDHKLAGLLLAKESNGIAVAFAIDGHHGGIPSAYRLGERLKSLDEDGAHRRDAENAVTSVEAFLAPRPLRLNNDKELALPTIPKKDHEMRVRFLTSCLVDADFLDTERHFDSSKTEQRATVPLSELRRPFSDYMRHLRQCSDNSEINIQRARYFDHVVARAGSCDTGLYRMSGPTGVGKTLAGLGAALTHAARNRQRRVVVALPYMTVTEQTADVYRQALGTENAVLEHHSDVSEQSDTYWRRLAAENWGAPVVVTTVVQLFESLFANTPAKLRKLHNLASAVILLDEAQTIPTGILDPVVEAINWLVRYAKSTVVLMTATQPAFDRIGPLKGVAMPDWGDIDMGTVFKRVHWHFGSRPVEAKTLAAQLAAQQSCLCIVNTVADAVRITGYLSEADPYCLHLSTRLCREHRRAVLTEVRSRLAEDRPCRLVATQLVEAGVDIDFPYVVRAMAPLPSLAQAAGRCNRNGRRPYGDLHVVELVDGRLPGGDYTAGTVSTKEIQERLKDEFDPEDRDVISKWHDHFYSFRSTFDDYDVNAARSDFDFPEVARRFRVIERNKQTLIVRWGNDAQIARLDALTERLRKGDMLSRSDWRFLSGFTVDIYRQHYDRAMQHGLVEVLDAAGIALWLGHYDNRLGVVLDRFDQEDLQW